MSLWFKSLLITMIIILSPQAYTAEKCPTNEPIKVIIHDWGTGEFLSNIHKYIYEELFDCNVELTPAGTVDGLELLIQGKADVMSELWYRSVEESANAAHENGQIILLQEVYDGGIEGWWIPKYVADQYPELKSVDDLVEFQNIFKLGQQKAALYSCPHGWGCNLINENLFKAFELEEAYELFIPLTSGELRQKIIQNYILQVPFVAYYWSPTAFIGNYEMQLLEMPKYNPEGHKCNSLKDCLTPYKSAYPKAKIHTAVSAKFSITAPELLEITQKVYIPNDTVNDVVGWGSLRQKKPEEIITYFFNNHTNLWTKWLTAAQVEQIKSSLMVKN